MLGTETYSRQLDPYVIMFSYEGSLRLSWLNQKLQSSLFLNPLVHGHKHKLLSVRSKSLQDCKKKLDFLHKAEKAHALDL